MKQPKYRCARLGCHSYASECIEWHPKTGTYLIRLCSPHAKAALGIPVESAESVVDPRYLYAAPSEPGKEEISFLRTIGYLS